MMEEIIISADKARLDIDFIHSFLSKHTYWAKNIPREIVDRAIANSLCFGVYTNNTQIGFARVISDLATFAYLADVFIVETYRGKGISKELLAYIKNYPDLQGLRRWMLATMDAHGLYEQFGFTPLAHPDRFMEIKIQNLYLKKTAK